MSNDVTVETVGPTAGEVVEVVTGVGRPVGGAEGETREVWRVVAVDGSTRVFQTKPAVESQGKRSAGRRVTPCDLRSKAGPAKPLFASGNTALPTLVAEGNPAAALQADTELSVELTSVTQAWPSLSPGIRGAVMALIRAASKGRPTRPASAPRPE
ncbi:MAG TPA: hypothetical protein VHD36_16820 [Pirellulales bacterium]|nr:hypothetical protein [Pirellulales bacterium]